MIYPQTYLDTKAAPELARYGKTIAEIREWVARQDQAEELQLAAKKEKRKLKKAKPKKKKEKGKKKTRKARKEKEEKEKKKTKKKKKKKTDGNKKIRKPRKEKETKHTEKPEKQSSKSKKESTKPEEKKQRKEKKKTEKEKAEKERNSKKPKEKTPTVVVLGKGVDKKPDPLPPRDFLKEKQEYEESDAFKAFAKTKGPGSTWTRQQVDEAETHLTFLQQGDGLVPRVRSNLPY